MGKSRIRLGRTSVLTRVFTLGAVVLPTLIACTSKGGSGTSDLSTEPSPTPVSFYLGADVSNLNELEDSGAVYRDAGVAQDALKILKAHGALNAIRLRVLVNPGNGYNNLANMLVMAKRVTALGFRILLDFHYGDYGTDAVQQPIPDGWKNYNLDQMKAAVYQHTKDAIVAMKNQNTLPDLVQIGNETTMGMLWPMGKIDYNGVGAGNDTPAQWSALTQLIQQGIQGVHDGAGSGPKIKTIIHLAVALDSSPNCAVCRYFFDHMKAANVNYDQIGLSFYPWWHGTLSQLAVAAADLAATYGKEINIVETSYPYTLNDTDPLLQYGANYMSNPALLHPGYPASVAGQKQFVTDLIALVRAIPGGKGVGVFYWAPEFISATSYGTPVENLSLFSSTAGSKVADLLDSISAMK